MQKALKGILACYGPETVIKNLFHQLNIAITTGDVLTGAKELREKTPNDLDFLAALVECFPVYGEDGEPLDWNLSAPWRSEDDKRLYESDADRIVIAKPL